MHKLILPMFFTLFILTSCSAGEEQPKEYNDPLIPKTQSASESWVLIAEGENLNLYHIDGEKSLKNSELFDISVFPMSDAAELKKGIKFDTVSDAYTVMEGFIN